MLYKFEIGKKQYETLVEFQKKFPLAFTCYFGEIKKYKEKITILLHADTESLLFQYLTKYGRFCLAKELDELNIKTNGNV